MLKRLFVAISAVALLTALSTPASAARSAAGTGRVPRAAASGVTVWVQNANSSTVTPVNSATGKAGTPVAVPAYPFGLAITPNGRTVYETDGGDLVTPINAATGRKGKVIHAQNGSAIAVTPNGKTGYVLGGSNVVVPINTITNKAEKAITVRPPGIGPYALAITPNGKTVYVLNYGGTVVPINTATNKAGKAIKTGKFEPMAIVITPDGKTAWVGGDQFPASGLNNNAQGFVLPINTTTNIPGRLIKVGKLVNCLVTTPWRSGPAQGPASCD